MTIMIRLTLAPQHLLALVLGLAGILAFG